MDELKRVLEENPKAKEEFDNIIEILNTGSIGQIKMWIEYANELEEMIEENVSREDMLQTIDNFNHLTEQMQHRGLLKENETWWESVL